MHIAEGILTGKTMAATTLAGVLVVAWGAAGMKKFVEQAPERKPLLGMAAAFIFLVSLIPLPAFTGTTSHPCGTPLAGILLGPSIAAGLACLALLLQAAFFAHGGFTSLGANTVTLGLLGAGAGWLAFRIGRGLGLPLWAAGALGGLLGDLAVYAGAGGMLSFHLAYFAAEPKFGLAGYMGAIYGAYLPTQGPIAVGEMLVTGWALHAIGTQRPEVLENLGVEKSGQKTKALLGLLLALGLCASTSSALAQPPAAVPAGSSPTAAAQEAPSSFPGMDEAVNEKMAEEAGAPARDPFINTESMGDLWNTLLLAAGGLAGFILGRNWHQLFGKKT